MTTHTTPAVSLQCALHINVMIVHGTTRPEMRCWQKGAFYCKLDNSSSKLEAEQSYTKTEADMNFMHPLGPPITYCCLILGLMQAKRLLMLLFRENVAHRHV